MHKNYINNGFVVDEKGNVTSVEVTDKKEDILHSEQNIELLNDEINGYEQNISSKKLSLKSLFV